LYVAVFRDTVEEDLQAVRVHYHLVEKGEELVHYIREKERQ
jgi:hypothetical protein